MEDHRSRATVTIGQARLLVVLAAVLWSTSGFFAKAPYFAGWPGPVLAFWRAAFACLVLWPMVRKPTWTWQFVPMTILFAAMNYTYLTAMAKGSAANAIWLQCTAPVWVLLVGVAFFQERAIKRDWLQIGFVATGVGLILYFETQDAALEAVLWGLASGVFYAGVVLSMRHLRNHDSIWLAALNHLVTVLVLAPFILDEAPTPGGVQWLLLFGFGVVQMGLPYVFFGHALKAITGHEAAGIAILEPLLLPAWVYLAWGEKPAWWTAVGGGLILLGLLIRYLEPKRREDPPVLVGGP
jgi:drug/metabolite transporter (DMT)-like permease